jgi:hypothetical protein
MLKKTQTRNINDGHAGIFELARRGEVAGLAGEDEEYCCLEHKELLRVCVRAEGVSIAGGV